LISIVSFDPFVFLFPASYINRCSHFCGASVVLRRLVNFVASPVERSVRNQTTEGLPDLLFGRINNRLLLLRPIYRLSFRLSYNNNTTACELCISFYLNYIFFTCLRYGELLIFLFESIDSLAVESIFYPYFLVYLGRSSLSLSLSLLRWRCFASFGIFSWSSPSLYIFYFRFSRYDECRLSLFGIFPSQFRGWCVLVIDIVPSEQLQLQVQE